MNLPASFGQLFNIGIFEKDGSSSVRKVTGPLFSSFGNAFGSEKMLQIGLEMEILQRLVQEL